jgi:hypothetical protein
LNPQTPLGTPLLGGPQSRYGRVRKFSPPPEFDPRTVQPVASRYTDWATRAQYSYKLSSHSDQYYPHPKYSL